MKVYCQGTEPDDTYLECVDHTRMCRAKNILFDFKNLKSMNSNDRYREDVIQPGDVGGYCKLNTVEFKKQGGHKSPLQSWYAELGYFEELDYKPIQEGKCDIVVNDPTYIIKLDAGINMYHHYCDFVNLYMTQHINNSFSQNVNIVIWDTSGGDYWSYFSDTWKVFSNRKLIHIKRYDGKRVCFRDATFSLLARMRYGHFYNMPIVSGCHATTLYRSFSEYVLHRLKIKQNGPLKDKLRVTMLARATAFRNVLNQDAVVKAIRSKLGKAIELNLVTYNQDTPFTEQLKQTYNSDIFMGMHGAGLTHLLFLPNWGTVFEIYNCDDTDCYLDLARLRGVKYFTWENESKLVQQDEGKHPQLGTPHKKFTNYSFDVDEFIRILKKMIKYVRQHPEFIEAKKLKHGESEILNTEL
jgi:EGF domain-specific O-GlcNAc transferase